MILARSSLNSDLGGKIKGVQFSVHCSLPLSSSPPVSSTHRPDSACALARTSSAAAFGRVQVSSSLSSPSSTASAAVRAHVNTLSSSSSSSSSSLLVLRWAPTSASASASPGSICGARSRRCLIGLPHSCFRLVFPDLLLFWGFPWCHFKLDSLGFVNSRQDYDRLAPVLFRLGVPELLSWRMVNHRA